MSSSTKARAIVQLGAHPASDPRSLVEQDVTVPAPGPHDLLVEVRAVSVNPADVQRRAKSAPGARGRLLGYDASGVVREVGDAVSLFHQGDEVFYAGAFDRPGSNAQLQLVDERIVGRRPKTLTHAESAAMPLTALTAWEGLFDKLRLDATSAGTLLVVGGAGGVGSMVIQIARVLLPKVRIIATASRPESAAWARQMGAHDIVDHHGDLAGQILDLVPDGIEWIFTTRSVGQLPVYTRALRPFGQVVAIDDPSTLDIVSMKSKALTWHWEFMFARSLHHSPDLQRQHEILDQVADLLDAGKLRTTVTSTFRPISAEQLREAHALVESGQVIGKVVLTNEPALTA